MNPHKESRSYDARREMNLLEREEKLQKIQTYKRKNQRQHPAFKKGRN